MQALPYLPATVYWPMAEEGGASQTTIRLANDIAKQGYSVLAGSTVQNAFATWSGVAWSAFASSWNRLALDGYMADGGHYRYRRYSVLGWSAQDRLLRLEPHQPHYQAKTFNALNGGIERHYRPLQRDALSNPCFGQIIAFCLTALDQIEEGFDWRIEVHQFRILALPDSGGKPTPEGLHRDGVDYVFTLLVRRRNISGGKTLLCDSAGKTLAEFMLQMPLDGVFLADHEVLHGVAPIYPLNLNEDAWRDVLILTFRRQ